MLQRYGPGLYLHNLQSVFFALAGQRRAPPFVFQLLAGPTFFRFLHFYPCPTCLLTLRTSLRKSAVGSARKLGVETAFAGNGVLGASVQKGGSLKVTG
jgi:hypothetical protein